MKNHFLVGLLYAIQLYKIIQTSTIDRKTCTEQITCAKCITADPKCSWCEDESFDEISFQRCDIAEKFRSCNQILSPENVPRIVKKNELSQPGAQTENIVQIAPQEIYLKLRPGKPETIKIKFRQAEDYPVDLYYIMDLSQSMNEHKKKLALLGDSLAAMMSKITKNFRLGFGSFVDKVALPYVSTIPERLKNPCTDSVCAAPYGFINHMPLSNKTSSFQNRVNSALLSGNLDAPEGGLDAIMQAAVCEKEIAWRDVSRKLIVFSTDSGYHIAGDGKLAGIIKPNDERCHLDINGNYTASVEQDYPSVGQLNKVLKDKKVHVIFAITDTQVTLYEQLSGRLEGSGVGILEQDSMNVVDLVQDQYNKITSKVELKDDAGKDIRVSYASRCLDKFGPLKQTSSCEHLKVGKEVEFDVTIELNRCPNNRDDWNKTFKISPVGVDESVVIRLDMICECDCEKPGIRQDNSAKCNDGNGSFQCGMCACNPGRHGRHCECGATDSSAKTDDEGCKRPNSTIICSNIGQCICGVCDCSATSKRGKPLSGKYCECDDYSCPMIQNKLCNGKGECKCGECYCDFGWEGKDCSCIQNENKCKAPGTDKICSDNGECICGRCVCKGTSKGRYIGQYCEECPGCTSQCETHWPCVVCRARFDGHTREICQNFTCPINVTLQDKVEAVKENERICLKTDDDNCKLTYKYGTENGEYYVVSEETKQCPVALNVTLIAVSVIAGVIAIGLCIALILKVIFMVHDKREFAKFENDRKAAKWDKSENPIYKPSTSTFQNPTYNQ